MDVINYSKIKKLRESINSLDAEVDAHKAEKAKHAKFSIGAVQSIPTATDTPILWGIKTPYNGEDFCEIDTTTNRIKILKKGLYQITVSVRFAAGTGGKRQFDSKVGCIAETYPMGDAAFVSTSYFVDVGANQMLQPMVYHNNNNSIDLTTAILFIRRVI